MKVMRFLEVSGLFQGYPSGVNFRGSNRSDGLLK
jgi:hypothetical protein